MERRATATINRVLQNYLQAGVSGVRKRDSHQIWVIWEISAASLLTVLFLFASFGGDHLFLHALGGEVVVDYSLWYKKDYGCNTGVTGYANDVMAYIPSRRVWEEGGYVEEVSAGHERKTP